MQFHIILNAHPDDPSSLAALRTCEAIIDSEHSIAQLFLYSDAVLLATEPRAPHNSTHYQAWHALIQMHTIDAITCSNSAQARQITTENIKPGFSIAGLAMLSEALMENQKILSFPPSHPKGEKPHA